jgi:hypothetical protein
MEVMKRPRSIGAEPSAENSSDPQCENNAFGSGASTNVKAAKSEVLVFNSSAFMIEEHAHTDE